MRFSRICLKRHQALCLLMVVALPLLAAMAGWAALCDTDYDPEGYRNTKCLLKLDDNTLWQAPGSTISFTIIGLDPQKFSVVAYLRFGHDPKAPNNWKGSFPLTPIRVGETQDKSGILFKVTLPSDLKLPDVSNGIYPVAEMRVMVSDPAASPQIVFDAVREIKFARHWFAFLLALAFVVGAAYVLHRFALFLGVPGTRALRLISTADGWASLAQFQIILWTLVIGAGAVYVMTIRGSLIEISGGALWLLGIAGAATLGSQFKNSQQARPAPSLARPSTIVNLSYEDISDSEVTFSWQVPSDGGAPSAYTVQYREHDAPVWSTATTTVARPRFRLVGLKSDTPYDLRVFATNAGGSGQPGEVTVKTAQPAEVHAEPKAPTWVGYLDPPTADSVPLSWYPLPQGAHYRVEYRAHDSDEPWRIHRLETASIATTVTELRSNTLYDFRVTAKDNSAWGSPSTIFRQSTGVHKPKWSDIVTDTDRPAEIDVTRVQMLFFTVISACFVAIKIVHGDAIPEIPQTYVTMMGISNGVYITAKFVGR